MILLVSTITSYGDGVSFNGKVPLRVDRDSRCCLRNRGKSGLQRAERQVTPGGCEPMESATEKIPPNFLGKGEMVW